MTLCYGRSRLVTMFNIEFSLHCDKSLRNQFSALSRSKSSSLLHADFLSNFSPSLLKSWEIFSGDIEKKLRNNHKKWMKLNVSFFIRGRKFLKLSALVHLSTSNYAKLIPMFLVFIFRIWARIRRWHCWRCIFPFTCKFVFGTFFVLSHKAQRIFCNGLYVCDGWSDAGLVKFKIFEVRLGLMAKEVVELTKN